jgi:sterol 3beta-glucosyltransferase
MRAVLTNFGTTGDIQPFLALAVEMRRRDHHPVLCTSPYFESRVKSLGLDFIPIGPDLHRFQREVIKAQLSDAIPIERMRALFAPMAAALPQVFSELREACRNVDVIISGPVQPAARMIHELTGVPFVSVQVAHFGGGGTQAFQQASAAFINQFRAQLKLPPLRHPLTLDANSPQLALYASSRYMNPIPPGWPDHYHMTGYFFLDDESWRPGPEIIDFLQAGEPPVVITFGSTCYDDTDAMSDLVLEAIAQAGCRALIQNGWSGLGQKRETPANILAAGYVPHHWLFPRSACIVHHGGAGTAAAAFRAAIPGVFVTHAGGQPLRARLACELGCAGPAIPYRHLTAGRLATAIRNTLDSPKYYRVAAELGEKIQAEDGVGKALQLIEALIAGKTSQGDRASF